MALFPPSGKIPLPDAPLVGALKLTDFAGLSPQELGALALQATSALSAGHHPASTGIQISLDNLCRLLMSCEPTESRVRRAIDAHPASPIEGYGPTLTSIRWTETEAGVSVTHSRYDSSTGIRTALAGRGANIEEALSDLSLQTGPLSEILRFREE